MKGSLFLNTTVHDLMNLLHCEHILQKYKNIFKYLSCMQLVLHLIKSLWIQGLSTNTFRQMQQFLDIQRQGVRYNSANEFFSCVKSQKMSLHLIRRPASFHTDGEVAIYSCLIESNKKYFPVNSFQQLRERQQNHLSQLSRF